MNALWENIIKYVGFAGSLVGIFWFAIANPEIISQQLYDAVNRALPFLMLGFGVMVGWSIRDSMKHRDAEIAASIERENAEHAEKMRRDREEYQTAKAVEKEEKEHQEKLCEATVAFKDFDVDTKTLVCLVYDNGEFVTDKSIYGEGDDFSYQVEHLTERETLPRDKYRFTLKPKVRELIDTYPELVVDVREYTRRMHAAADKETTRENPESMMQFMSADELHALQDIIDNKGRADTDAVLKGDLYQTLDDFGMLLEYCDNPYDPPVYDLDPSILEFLQREENKDLIDRYINKLRTNRESRGK